MVFDKQTKQAFIHPAKTGTQTIRAFLKSVGWKELPMTHSPLDVLIEKYPNLNDYTVYGFLRNPLSRFESAILHLKRGPAIDKFFEKALRENGIDSSLEAASYEAVISVFPQVLQSTGGFLVPQSYWLNHPKVTVLDFDNLESELRRISGNTTQPIEMLNTATDFGRSEITQAVRDFVRQEYAIDYALAKDKLGKEY